MRGTVQADDAFGVCRKPILWSESQAGATLSAAQAIHVKKAGVYLRTFRLVGSLAACLALLTTTTKRGQHLLLLLPLLR